ncbi:hypothetical protein CPB84DRAFT_1849505 [Gymnopilus junonius]|uniref:Uncharacterized protein n=1 Tax=Gymnopilus junonius TaxID=109634 RepID=A0A9P5NKH2_GYMJU|nr:hypothetical protein CPB84DRAFT_1849505 [Gymnopilus junonius]
MSSSSFNINMHLTLSGSEEEVQCMLAEFSDNKLHYEVMSANALTVQTWQVEILEAEAEMVMEMEESEEQEDGQEMEAEEEEAEAVMEVGTESTSKKRKEEEEEAMGEVWVTHCPGPTRVTGLDEGGEEALESGEGSKGGQEKNMILHVGKLQEVHRKRRMNGKVTCREMIRKMEDLVVEVEELVVDVKAFYECRQKSWGMPILAAAASPISYESCSSRSPTTMLDTTASSSITVSNSDDGDEDGKNDNNDSRTNIQHEPTEPAAPTAPTEPIELIEPIEQGVIDPPVIDMIQNFILYLYL